MTLKRLIFHIGLPKTGTSALQVFFAKNREAMLASGLDYLPIGRLSLGAEGKISSGNGGMLARCLNTKPGEHKPATLLAARAEFIEAVQASAAPIGLVSSETLAHVDEAVFAELISELRAMGVVSEVIYFIRDQEQTLCSGYMQQVKRHQCIEPAELYIARTFRREDRLHYAVLYDEMLRLFEGGKVMCCTYEEAMKAPSGIFGAFMQAIGISASRLDFATKDVNNSLEPAEIAIMLVLNKYAPRMFFSDLVVENSRDVGRTRSGEIHRFISADLAARIHDTFAEGNAAFARRYFKRDDLFAVPDPQAPRYDLAAERVDPGDIVEIFGGLLVRYDQRIAALEQRLANMRPGAGKARED